MDSSSDEDVCVWLNVTLIIGLCIVTDWLWDKVVDCVDDSVEEASSCWLALTFSDWSCVLSLDEVCPVPIDADSFCPTFEPSAVVTFWFWLESAD